MSMYTKAAIRGHALHPILITFPITFYCLAPLCFAIFEWFNHSPFWYELARFSVWAGIVTAVVAAIPGLIDWSFGIPRNTAAHRRGLWHMILNSAALALFAGTAILISRSGAGTAGVVPEFCLTVVAMVVTGVSGYHGGELISTHKVGVRMTPSQMRYEKIQNMNPAAHESDS